MLLDENFTIMAVSLQPASPADVPILLALIRELAEYEHLAPQVQATEARLRTALFPAQGHPAAEAVVARVEGQPAGYAFFFTTFSTFLARPGLWLEDLYVRPEYRHRGLGKALWHHVAAEARRRGCGRFEWTVLDWNASAIRFYESLGAKRLPEWQLCRLELVPAGPEAPERAG